MPPFKRPASPPSEFAHLSPPPIKQRKLSPNSPSPPAVVCHSNNKPKLKLVKSPFSLTSIHDLPPSQNVDCVSLSDILCDPLIREAWIFNYLHDVDFIMSHLDPDVKATIEVHVVHGFWKKDDPNRLDLYENASQYPNITLHTAFMPEMFGTHHSKMIILLRHDDTAQVIIHTANMIDKDWRNMTQGIWRSPLLPLLCATSSSQAPRPSSPPPSSYTSGAAPTRTRHNTATTLPPANYGSGERFKHDLLAYLQAYDRRYVVCKPLRVKLSQYSFADVKGALVASIPGRFRQAENLAQHTEIPHPPATCWGLQALSQILSSVPINRSDVDTDGDSRCEKHPQVVCQVSSVATLGPTDRWLKQLVGALSMSRLDSTTTDTAKPHTTMTENGIETKFIFPTADEIRRSLNGYYSGGSIHWKTQSAQQQKQLAYMQPMLHHWANDDGGRADQGSSSGGVGGSVGGVLNSGRCRAAPHIKTYIRYSDNNKTGSPASVDWALLTSANVSKQAWGDQKDVEIRIASWEIGVLVWPALFSDGNINSNTILLPSFRQDTPGEEDVQPVETNTTVVGLRMPYNLPLKKYEKDEVPWVATARHTQPDWRGAKWAA